MPVLTSNDIHFTEIELLPQMKIYTEDQLLELKAISAILPFKTNSYIDNELIDWNNIPDDPIYQMIYPQLGMLPERECAMISEYIVNNSDRDTINAMAHLIRSRLIPLEEPDQLNELPSLDGKPVNGLYRQFRNTLLAFPAHGQNCFAYCNYCIRWMKHAGAGIDFCYNAPDVVAKYLHFHPEISDILITGGDPLMMRTDIIRNYVEPLLKVESLQTIRFSTRVIAWWPGRITNEHDSDDLLRLFEEIVSSGKHLSIIGHISHPREISTKNAQLAVKRILSTGAAIRCQSPLLKKVNDNVQTLKDLWKSEIKLGMIPYYLFLESEAGLKDYYKIPISTALKIYQQAQREVTGLARTVRGPVAYNVVSKTLVSDTITIGENKFFLLKYIQSTNTELIGKTYLAEYNENATQIDQLKSFSM